MVRSLGTDEGSMCVSPLWRVADAVSVGGGRGAGSRTSGRVIGGDPASAQLRPHRADSPMAGDPRPRNEVRPIRTLLLGGGGADPLPHGLRQRPGDGRGSNRPGAKGDQHPVGGARLALRLQQGRRARNKSNKSRRGQRLLREAEDHSHPCLHLGSRGGLRGPRSAVHDLRHSSVVLPRRRDAAPAESSTVDCSRDAAKRVGKRVWTIFPSLSGKWAL
jgi:hypothetical protein